MNIFVYYLFIFYDKIISFLNKKNEQNVFNTMIDG